MVVLVPWNTLINRHAYGITHFLRIPYATRQSRPQLLESLNRIAQDPIATALPKETWCHPERLHFAIGLLRLKSPERVREACQLLQDISVKYRAALGLGPILKQRYRWMSDLFHNSKVAKAERFYTRLESALTSCSSSAWPTGTAPPAIPKKRDEVDLQRQRASALLDPFQFSDYRHFRCRRFHTRDTTETRLATGLHYGYQICQIRRPQNETFNQTEGVVPKPTIRCIRPTCKV